MEQTGRNQWQPMANANATKTASTSQTVATGCDQLPIGAHGKEGVDGSSPSEGFHRSPAKAGFLSSNELTHLTARVRSRYASVTPACRSRPFSAVSFTPNVESRGDLSTWDRRLLERIPADLKKRDRVGQLQTARRSALRCHRDLSSN
jgi:hypothetical protein